MTNSFLDSFLKACEIVFKQLSDKELLIKKSEKDKNILNNSFLMANFSYKNMNFSILIGSKIISLVLNYLIYDKENISELNNIDLLTGKDILNDIFRKFLNILNNNKYNDYNLNSFEILNTYPDFNKFYLLFSYDVYCNKLVDKIDLAIDFEAYKNLYSINDSMIQNEKIDTYNNKTLDTFMNMKLPLRVKVGGCKIPLKEVFNLNLGYIMQLEQKVDEPLEIFVHDKLFAKGKFVVVNGVFGIKIIEIINKKERLDYIK